MEPVVRPVSDLPLEERRLYESVLGRPLREDQQVILQVTKQAEAPRGARPGTDQTPGPARSLPQWCRVYEGLSDDQIADLEQTILCRSDFSRPSR